MEYNSQRPHLVLPEYGRNVQQMVDYAMGVADREERNKVVHAIISVMGQLFPHLRDIDDFKHKLWDHLHIMSNYQLDVDSPYPKPEPSQFEEPPERIAYPKRAFKYGHYGKILEGLIKKASEYPEGEEKDILTLMIANQMKKHYLLWNRDTVEDNVITKQLGELSNGKLALKEGQTLAEASILAPRSARPDKRKPGKGGKGGGKGGMKGKKRR